MRNRTVIALAILVCGLVVGCLSSGGSAGAAPPGPEDSDATNAGGGVNKARSGALRPDWKLSAPITSGNLTVFPVTASAWAGAGNFITLDEGLRSGKVVITELGAGRRTSGRGQRDSAEVNTLSLTNRTGRTLILLAGEMLIGGKQDRIVDQDQLVPPDDLPIALGVFCVEHGRWQGASTGFGQNQTAHSPQVPGARNFLGEGSSGGGGGVGQIATPAVREKAEARKDQNEVWSKVAETTKVLNATSGTGALTRVYQDGSVARKTRAYESQIRYRVQGNNVVGVVVAVNGRLVAADIFASPSLFQRYWPKLLKSYVLEALGETATADKADRLAAETFLFRGQGNSSSGGKNGVYRLTERKSGGDTSFELEYLASAQPVLLHFNRIASR